MSQRYAAKMALAIFLVVLSTSIHLKNIALNYCNRCYVKPNH